MAALPRPAPPGTHRQRPALVRVLPCRSLCGPPRQHRRNPAAAEPGERSMTAVASELARLHQTGELVTLSPPVPVSPGVVRVAVTVRAPAVAVPNAGNRRGVVIAAGALGAAVLIGGVVVAVWLAVTWLLAHLAAVV